MLIFNCDSVIRPLTRSYFTNMYDSSKSIRRTICFYFSGLGKMRLHLILLPKQLPDQQPLLRVHSYSLLLPLLPLVRSLPPDHRTLQLMLYHLLQLFVVNAVHQWGLLERLAIPRYLRLLNCLLMKSTTKAEASTLVASSPGQSASISSFHNTAIL